MLEIAPRFTYSPDGVLELRKTIGSESDSPPAALDTQKEFLAGQPGYEINEDGSETTVRVQLSKVIRASRELSFTNPSAAKLIENLRLFTYSDYEDLRDGVFSIDFWSEYGGTGQIYPQLQRWLNTDGLDETVAKHCINAMAYPFGADARQQAKKEFRYRTDGRNAAAGMGGFTFGIVSRKEAFGVSVVDETGDIPSYKQGEVGWNWVDLSTLGSCACWGASWQERERVYISPQTKRLYEMGPHNVDFAVQSLSLALGMGVLAYAASRYQGTEDILAETRWKPERS